jgi:hypothetical protein
MQATVGNMAVGWRHDSDHKKHLKELINGEAEFQFSEATERACKEKKERRKKTKQTRETLNKARGKSGPSGG